VHTEGISEPTAEPRLQRLAPLIAALALFAAMVAPRGSAVTLVAMAVLAGAGLASARDLSALRPHSALSAVMLAFGAYLAVNWLWSADRSEALGKVVFYFTALGLSHATVVGLSHTAPALRRRIGLWMIGAFFLGLLYLAVEIIFDQPIRRGLFSAIPILRLDPKHIRVVDGQVVAIHSYTLNRSMAVLVLSFWPVVLLMRGLLPRRVFPPAAAAAAALAVIAVFGSEHETSKLAVIFSGVAFAGMFVAAFIMRRAIIAGWVAASLLVVPIAALAYSGELHKSTLIPETGRNRIILWGYTAQLIRHAPLFGTGIASTKLLDQEAGPSAQRPADYTYALRTGRHSHNIFMQTWYELGAIGAVFMLAIGLTVLALLARLSSAIGPYAQASFVSAVTIGCFSWGMWQTWFMAAYAVWALLLVFAIMIAREAEVPRAPPR
jgi:hypothetical protein